MVLEVVSGIAQNRSRHTRSSVPARVSTSLNPSGMVLVPTTSRIVLLLVKAAGGAARVLSATVLVSIGPEGAGGKIRPSPLPPGKDPGGNKGNVAAPDPDGISPSKVCMICAACCSGVPPAALAPANPVKPEENMASTIARWGPELEQTLNFKSVFRTTLRQNGWRNKH